MSTWEKNPPRVELIGFTPHPLSVIYEIWCRAKDIPIEPRGSWDPPFTQNLKRREAEVETFRKLVFDYTQIPEMVSFTWWLEGVPRAFFDQVVRHRKTSMFARSQRVRLQKDFADKGEYLTTSECAKDNMREVVYDLAMRQSEKAYNELLELGVPAEDARGVLPLHLRTGFAWGTSLRDLTETFRTRTCHLLQQEYWAPIAKRMRRYLRDIDPELEVIFKPPCQRGAGCVSTHDAELRVKAVAEGRTDMHPCRIWTDQFADQSTKNTLNAMVSAGSLRWATSPEEAA